MPKVNKAFNFANFRNDQERPGRNAKLSKEEAAVIKRELGKDSSRDRIWALATEYGVTASTIRGILYGETWEWVDAAPEEGEG